MLPIAPIDLRSLRGLIPLLVPGPAGQGLASLVPTTPISLIVNNVGNPDLKEESVTAYEVAYTGTFNNKTTIGIAVYRNETNDNINFTTVTPSASFPTGGPFFDVYRLTIRLPAARRRASPDRCTLSCSRRGSPASRFRGRSPRT